MPPKKPSHKASDSSAASSVPAEPTAALARSALPNPESAASTVTIAPPAAIVGIGASAGGLEAFEAFFRARPDGAGLAFVLVPHLDPTHESQLAEILQRATTMPVIEALDQIAVERDHVYIIPPNREITILNGVLQLNAPDMPRGQRLPIDGFLRSLAKDQTSRAIGIILSGTATDGTLGLRAIVGHGGVSLVQEPSTAKYDGMLQSAIKAGYATHVLPVGAMPAMLREVVRRAGPGRQATAELSPKVQSGINQVLMQLRSSTRHDFSQYKKSTVSRRIQRRMALHAIDDEAVYARFIKGNAAEAQLLFREMLINVTCFFRDPEAFVVLKENILRPMLMAKRAEDDFRVWVAGCASGEEAYSIAMVLRELQDEIAARHDREQAFQIYATDLDDDAIATARAGRYPPNIAQDMTPERLRRFFIKDDSGYKVKKEIRDMVVFAVHNVLKDPPFTKLDLLSCRNLMIYLEPELQDRLIPSFHYALRPGGALFLSTSESITGHPLLFTALDRKWKFYRPNGTEAPARSVAGIEANWLPGTRATGRGRRGINPTEDELPAGSTARLRRADTVVAKSAYAMLQHYAPPSVTTDSRGNILHVHGDTGRYLRPAPGPISNNVVEMARDGLQSALRAAIHAATAGSVTHSQQVLVKTDDRFSAVRLCVRALPQHEHADPLLLVSFEEARDADTAAALTLAPTPAPNSRQKAGGSRGRGTLSAQTARASKNSNMSSATPAKTCEPRVRSSRHSARSSDRPMRNCNPPTKSSNPPTKNSKPPRKSCSP